MTGIAAAAEAAVAVAVAMEIVAENIMVIVTNNGIPEQFVYVNLPG